MGKDNKQNNKTTNILLCGVGGQGVILASTIISHAGLKEGFDVKKSEVHGMSQRGGAVVSHIRIGEKVYSPLIPTGEADYLISLNPMETRRNKHFIKDNGKILECSEELISSLESIRSQNICLVGILSKYLDINDKTWKSVINEKIKPKLVELNLKAYELGRQSGEN
jgi:indolepyruvate ferredoxin oxidoreductase beta subunit